MSVANEASVKPSPPLHIPSLDGIRAVAFLIVFVSHVPFGTRVPGGFGVTVFFFLSGYLITTLLRLEAEKTGTVSLKDFYLRRALRILPPMYLALLASVVASVLVGRTVGVGTTLLQALHLTNYVVIYAGDHAMAAGTKIFWSLAIEEHYYLFFPLAFLLLRTKLTRRGQAVALLLLCALVLAWRCALFFVWKVPAIRLSHATDARVDSILFGAALALGANPALGEVRWSRATTWGLFGIGMVLLFASLLPREDSFRETVRYSIQGVALAPVFVAAIRLHETPLFRWLSWRWVRAVGLISYMLYLVHLTAIELLTDAGIRNGYVLAFVALVLSVIVATLSYHLVERPLARRRRRLSVVPHS